MKRKYAILALLLLVLTINACSGDTGATLTTDVAPGSVTSTITIKPHLRSEPAIIASTAEMLPWIRKNGFNHPGFISSDKGLANGIQGDFQHEYEVIIFKGQTVVFDRATGLMWQQPGPTQPMTWENAKNYIDHLNTEKYAGFADWHLPTLEELLSLMEATQTNGIFYLDPAFDTKETRYHYWSADQRPSGHAWVVSFSSGYVYDGYANYYDGYVLAVRLER